MTTYWTGYANKFPMPRLAPRVEDRRRTNERLSRESSGFWTTEQSGKTCLLNLEPRVLFTAGFVSGLRPESSRYLWEKRAPWSSSRMGSRFTSALLTEPLPRPRAEETGLA